MSFVATLVVLNATLRSPIELYFGFDLQQPLAVMLGRLKYCADGPPGGAVVHMTNFSDPSPCAPCNQKVLNLVCWYSHFVGVSTVLIFLKTTLYHQQVYYNI